MTEAIHLVLYCFITCIVINFLYYIIFFQRLITFENSTVIKDPPKVPVSVIICAKNEAENLKNLIPELANQNYPSYEIIVVNDNSTDKTKEVVEEFQLIYSNLKLVSVRQVEAFWGNKKYALTLGIKSALHEHLLFTDADCIPINNNWISEMSSKFDDQKSIVLGYSGYYKIKHSIINKIIRFETLLTASQYLSYASYKTPYMGVGRNLAYKKSLFFKANGFHNHMKIKSGDDDLFVNQNSNSWNTTININPESFTLSIPKDSFKSWFRQKRRHLSTSKYYQRKHKLLLGLFFVSQLGIWTFIFILMFSQYSLLASIFILIKLIYTYIILGLISKKLNEKDLIPFFILLEPLLILSQLIIFTTNTISKPTHWN